MVIWLRPSVVFGLEKISRSFPVMLSLASTWMRHAVKPVPAGHCGWTDVHTRSCPNRGWWRMARCCLPGCHACSCIRNPGSISATCASVVFVRARLCRCQVVPRSLLYMIPAFGIRVESMNWIGKTNVPSFIVMPRPGPCKQEAPGRIFHPAGVMLDRLAQFRSCRLRF